VGQWIPAENKGTTLVVGKSATVKLEVFNAGSQYARNPVVPRPDRSRPAHLSTAYGVELKDSPWQGEAAVDDVKTVGETTKRFATIEPGASVTMTYSLTAPAPGSLLGPPAQVTYRASVTEDKGRAGFSTGYSTRVISSFESAMDLALWAGTYGTLGVLQTKVAWRNTIVVAVLAAVALLANTLHKNHLESAKRRRQIKYEAEFMNSK